jgi:hypothetical protein
MNSSGASPNDESESQKTARLLFERAMALKNPDVTLVDALTLAIHVEISSGKPYGPKNIKKALLAAGCQPHLKASGRSPARWRYSDLLPILRAFSKGRADGIFWPSRAAELKRS